MRFLDLFSGIGGFALGLVRAGFTPAAFCEIDPVARAVLKSHWPRTKCYEDIRSLDAKRLSQDKICFSLICGGFPCQDISLLGEQKGLIRGPQSSLWFDMLRLISETKPKYILIENVDAIRVKGLDVILRGLSEIGYAAEWHCIPAYSVGAPHRRERIWIISYPDIEGLERFSGNDQIRYTWPQPHGPACEKDLFSRKHFSRWWATEPKLGRVAHGIPRRVDRIKLLGNSVVPQIVTILGKAILARESLIN